MTADRIDVKLEDWMRSQRLRANALMGRKVTASWTEYGNSNRVGVDPDYPLQVPCHVTVRGEVVGWQVSTDHQATVTIAGYGPVNIAAVPEIPPAGPLWRRVAFYLGLVKGL